MKRFKILSALLSTMLLSAGLFAQSTTVKGMVYDETGEPMGFVMAVWAGTYQGTEVEWDGSFEMTTDDTSLTAIEFGFVGYKTKVVTIEPGQGQEIRVDMEVEGETMEAVEVTRERPKKDTAAIALFRRVVKAKDKLRESQYDYYQYEEYAKTEFDLFNVKEKFTKRRIMKPFEFVFENMDTTENGEAFLPVLLKEEVMDVYYRKSPKKKKEIVKGEQFSGIDNNQFFEVVDYGFPSIDIYDKTVVVGTKGFVNPFSAGARFTYKYFLEDSMQIGDHFCYKLQFTPRRKADLAFVGDAWIDKESAMIKSIQLYVLDQINVNFLTGMEIRQDFSNLGGDKWFKTYERMETILNLLEKEEGQAFRVVRTGMRKDVIVNRKIPDATLDGDAKAIQEGAYKRDTTYWADARHEDLNETEAAIYSTMNRVKKTRAYKTYRYLGQVVSSGFFNAGKVEFGRFFQFVSWNGLEGTRLRFGIRTAPKFFRDKFSIGGYGAYGTKDKLWKYHFGFSAHLKRTNNKWHMIGGHYRYDWSDFNFKNPYMTHDHILSSLLRRKPLKNLFLIREGYGFYEKEWIKGFTNKFSFKHRRVYSWDESSYDVSGAENGGNSFATAEFSVNTEYGLNQLFVTRQGGSSRQAVDINAPVFNLNYTAGIKGLFKSDYSYHVLGGGVRYKHVSRIGKTFYDLQANKIFGERIPFPLLSVHKGNQAYLYNRFLYNMMLDQEFVTDTETTLFVRHFFDGFLTNLIPGVRKLKLRTMVYGKAIYGGMSNSNKQLLTSNESGLKPLEGFYAETGVGLLNIFKLIEIYGFMRHTQLNDPGVSRFGFKFMIGVSL